MLAEGKEKTISVKNEEKYAVSSGMGKFFVFASFIFIVPIFSFITKRNQLITKQSKINEAASGIDVQLASRRDTLTKLVDATKGTMKWEKELLTEVTEMRKDTISPENRADVHAQQTMIAGKIMGRMEAYPELKSTEAVAKLMDASTIAEQEIAAARRIYNSYVSAYNANIMTWPTSVTSASMQLHTLPMFKATAAQLQDVKLDL